MTFYFRTFRRALSVTMLLFSAFTIVLVFFMLPSFSHSAIPWLLVAIQALSFMRTSWSVTRKLLFNSSQSVASEAISLFSLFPFHLILALIIATTEFKDRASFTIYSLLQTFVIGGSVIHMVYTTSLILIAMLTVSAFDHDVWIRDIDSSPSPFPIPIIFAFLRPRSILWWRCKRLGYNAADPAAHEICTSYCNCPGKAMQPLQPEQPKVTGEEHVIQDKSPLRTLIRVPDAAERRISIAVSFETVGRLN